MVAPSRLPAGTGKDACPTEQLTDDMSDHLPAGTGKDACPTLSIAGGKKCFGGFRFVFMEIRVVIGFGLKKRGARPQSG
jgi:hypothetical protein